MKISISLAAMTGAFETDMNRASKTAQKQMRDIERQAKRVGVAVGAAFAAMSAAVAAGVKSAINTADELGKMAQRTGLSVEALSRLEVAASQSDTSLESLQKAMVNLGRAQLDARKGTQDQVALFKALGIELTDLERLSPDQLLKRIADAFQATADSPEKAAVAMKLFGRAGADLIPLLNGGSEELERFERLSDELGNTISTETARAAAEFNDTLDLVKIGVNGVWRTVAAELLPTLNKLAADFNDPKFRQGFASIVGGAVEATVAVAGLISEIGNVAKFVGEELAFRQTGQAAADDIARLEQQAQQIRERIERQPKVILWDLGGTAERRKELEAELAKVETLIKDYWDRIEREGPKGATTPEGATDPAAPALGIDFDAWEKAVKDRERATAAAAASRSAEAAATRAQAEADRAAAQAQREAEAASADFLRATENLRAELEGPLAQVQLDYIRREDELIRLGKLAGLTQEELASSLDLLEQARTRDVDAIKAQIEAEKALQKAQEEAPLIRQMDELRDTTAGFFVDLVKNGKDAIDRLQDYLLTMALESIGRQIAEGLFGNFGTTGGGSAGGGFGAFLGSLFGGARAAGGDVMPGRAYLVGEEGPELVMPKSAGTVIPAAQTAAMGRGITVGGDTINIMGATSNRALQHLEISKARRMRRFERDFS